MGNGQQPPGHSQVGGVQVSEYSALVELHGLGL